MKSRTAVLLWFSALLAGAALSCSGEIGAPGSDSDGPSRDLGADAPDVSVPYDPSQKGPLGCPTVSSASTTSSPDLSDGYRTACAACHGADGSGDDNYPDLTTVESFEVYQGVVRTGQGVMAGFGPEFLSDAELRADYDALRAGVRPGATGSKYDDWSDTEIEAAYSEGLALFRKPDPKGEACANCHAPDGIDLAVIGFADDSILRRALLHLDVADSVKLVDFVHAQRIRFGITAPCSPTWRPLQPGGEVLGGEELARRSDEARRVDTGDDFHDGYRVEQEIRQQQDQLFFETLRDREYILATGRVDSLEKAHQVRRQMLETNLRLLPIGVPLPRYSEDGFFGGAHRSADDWIPETAFVPDDASSYYAEVDSYLADPTDEALTELMGLEGEETHRPAVDEMPEDLDGRRWLRSVNGNKRSAQLFFQHFLRQELLGRTPGWYDREPVPIAGHYGNPFFGMAQENFSVCDGDDCENNFPEPVFEDFSGNVSRHHWYTLSQLFDNTLLESYGFAGNTYHAGYWQDLFVAHSIHQTFYNFHRQMLQLQYETDQGFFGWVRYGDAEARTPALLNGEYMNLTVGQATGGQTIETHQQIVNVNAMRTYLYLMRQFLESGYPVEHGDKLMAEIESWRGIMEYERGESRLDEISAISGEWESFFGNFDLHDEVISLIGAAEELATE